VESLGTVLIGLGLSLSACGGTTQSSFDDSPVAGGGGSEHAGASGAPAGGAPAGQGAASGGGVGGIAQGGGPRHVDPEGGSTSSGGAPSPLGCDEPSGGPRSDGPAPIVGACDAIPDEVLVERFQRYAERVPRGFFYDAKPWKGLLLEPCSNSAEDTAALGSSVGLVGLEATFTTPWFYEASFCGDGPRRSVRNLRCDYFDGQVLAPTTPEELAFLASIFWWVDNRDLAGAALLGYAIMSGDATAWVDMCTLSGSFGDFGLCDQIRLERTRHAISYEGKVILGEPELVRTIEGACH
jgi:hypothetical protein